LKVKEITLATIITGLMVFSIITVYSSKVGGVTPSVKITSPVKGQKIPVDSKNLTVYGISSNNTNPKCIVSVLLNDLKPYKKVGSAENNRPGDFSTWKYTFTSSNNSVIKEGANRLTSKIACNGNGNLNGTSNYSLKFNSVNFTGILKTAHNPITPSKLDNNTQSKQIKHILPTRVQPASGELSNKSNTNFGKTNNVTLSTYKTKTNITSAVPNAGKVIIPKQHLTPQTVILPNNSTNSTIPAKNNVTSPSNNTSTKTNATTAAVPNAGQVMIPNSSNFNNSTNSTIPAKNNVTSPSNNTSTKTNATTAAVPNALKALIHNQQNREQNTSSTTVIQAGGSFPFVLPIPSPVLKSNNSRASSQSFYDTNTVTNAKQIPPIADAGSTVQVVNGGSTVTLNGSASKAPSGAIVSYLWKQIPTNSPVTLSGAYTPVLRFTAPRVSSDTTLIFELKVTDNLGQSSSTMVDVIDKKTPGTASAPATPLVKNSGINSEKLNRIPNASNQSMKISSDTSKSQNISSRFLINNTQVIIPPRTLQVNQSLGNPTSSTSPPLIPKPFRSVA
jgi:hypothetical protein